MTEPLPIQYLLAHMSILGPIRNIHLVLSSLCLDYPFGRSVLDRLQHVVGEKKGHNRISINYTQQPGRKTEDKDFGKGGRINVNTKQHEHTHTQREFGRR